MKPAPFLLEPILKEKVWGGRRLASYNKQLPDEANIGESWELCDLPRTAASGGGGGAAHSLIGSGEARGVALNDAVRAMGANLMGHAALTPEGGFPLLVKYLDAREDLSVQVHPSPAYAEAHKNADLKTETWIVLAAEPGAVIYRGLVPGTTREALEAAIKAGTVPELMNAIPASPGDVHHLPSGTVHALGAGVLVAEIQSPSDTTFRVYDWGRTDREIHIEQALTCIDFSNTCAPEPVRVAQRTEPVTDGVKLGIVESNELYEISVLDALGSRKHAVNTSPDAPVVLMFTSGAGTVHADPDPGEPLHYKAGDTVLVPARVDAVRIETSRDTRCVITHLRERR
jgi:mannose-6-phosphate isomerase